MGVSKQVSNSNGKGSGSPVGCSTKPSSNCLGKGGSPVVPQARQHTKAKASEVSGSSVQESSPSVRASPTSVKSRTPEVRKAEADAAKAAWRERIAEAKAASIRDDLWVEEGDGFAVMYTLLITKCLITKTGDTT